MNLPAPSKRLPPDCSIPRHCASRGIRPGVCAPLPTSRSCVHSQSPLPMTFGQPFTRRPVTVRPRGFSPPRRFPPHARSGYFATRAGRGSLRFRIRGPVQRHRTHSSTNLPAHLRCRRVRDPLSGARPIPATRFTPFEEFRSPVAVPHRCGRCPLVVSAARCTTHARWLVCARVAPTEVGAVPVRDLPHIRRPCRRSDRASLRRAMAIELDARCPLPTPAGAEA
jgi:hypothetical protein